MIKRLTVELRRQSFKKTIKFFIRRNSFFGEVSRMSAATFQNLQKYCVVLRETFKIYKSTMSFCGNLLKLLKHRADMRELFAIF